MMRKGCASSKPQCVMNAGDLLRSRAGVFLTIKGMKAAFLFFGVALLFFYHQPLLFYLFKQLLKNFIKCSKILKSEIAQNRTA